MMRLVHIKDGVVFAMHAPEVTDLTLDLPRKPQRFALKPGKVTLRPIVAPPKPKRAPYRPVSILGRHDDECAFIGASGLCCGRRTISKSSWCVEHEDVVFIRARPVNSERKLEAAE